MFEKKIITKNVYFASIRNGIIKELCGKYKVSPLLNECGDPPFFSKFKFPLGNQPIGKVWLKIYVQLTYILSSVIIDQLYMIKFHNGGPCNFAFVVLSDRFLKTFKVTILPEHGIHFGGGTSGGDVV